MMDAPLNLLVASLAVIVLLLPQVWPTVNKIFAKLGIFLAALSAIYSIYAIATYKEKPPVHDPDGIYQDGKLVANVNWRLPSQITLPSIRSAKPIEIDLSKYLEWGNLTLKCQEPLQNHTSVISNRVSYEWEQVTCHIMEIKEKN